MRGYFRDFEIKLFAEREIHKSRPMNSPRKPGDLKVVKIHEYDSETEKIFFLHEVTFISAFDIMDNMYWKYSHISSQQQTMKII